MKTLKLINGMEKIVQDDEAENIANMWLEDSSRPIRLRDGAVINPKSISMIDKCDQVEMWSIYRVYETKAGKFIQRDGNQCFLTPENIKEIKLVDKVNADTTEEKQVLRIAEHQNKVAVIN